MVFQILKKDIWYFWSLDMFIFDHDNLISEKTLMKFKEK